MVLGACGSGTGNQAGGGNEQQQNQKPGEIGAQDQVYKRPKVNDAGDVTIAVEENYRDYNNFIGATNSQASTRVGNITIPSPYVGVYTNGQILPEIDGDLMESVKVVSPDPQVVEYKFQKAAVWEDGSPIGCTDIYLGYVAHGLASDKFDSEKTGYEDISKVECKDDNKTATLTFGKKFADYRGLFSSIGNNGLLPEHVLKAKTGVDVTQITKDNVASKAADIDKASKFYTTDWQKHDPSVAVSGGPYRVKTTDLRDTTVLERNPKWWGNPGGPATITLRTNTNAQSASQQLQNKEVQAIDVQADAPTATQLSKVSTVKTFAQGGQTYEHIDFNMSKPLFKDNPELRNAIATCINRQAIIDNLIKDINPNAKPLGNFMFMPNEAGYEDHYSNIGKGDADAAKKLMEGGGWKLNGDGIYEKNGTKASFTLGYKTVVRRNKTYQLVADSCKKAGIQVISGQQDSFNDESLPKSNFDAALFAWVGNLVKSSSYANYASQSAGGTSNYALYSDPDMDKAYAEANANLDFKSRVDQLNNVDKIIAKDMFSVPLFQLPDYTAYDAGWGASDGTKVGDLSYVNFAGGVTWNVYAWQKRQ
ncbi:ABC transporter family substrate-binding protein [Actinocrispum wychmicini]|nr:ABC transporter family substrate-binding protein [Actinocrispum wychmicini]